MLTDAERQTREGAYFWEVVVRQPEKFALCGVIGVMLWTLSCGGPADAGMSREDAVRRFGDACLTGSPARASSWT